MPLERRGRSAAAIVSPRSCRAIASWPRTGSARSVSSASGTSGACWRSKMSLSDDLRDELAAIEPARRCCALAELSALCHAAGTWHLQGRGELSVQLDLASSAIARRAFSLLRDLGVRSGIRTYPRHAFDRATRYQLELEVDPAAAAMLREAGVLSPAARRCASSQTRGRTVLLPRRVPAGCVPRGRLALGAESPAPRTACDRARRRPAPRRDRRPRRRGAEDDRAAGPRRRLRQVGRDDRRPARARRRRRDRPAPRRARRRRGDPRRMRTGSQTPTRRTSSAP